jgi:hypothetical protein
MPQHLAAALAVWHTSPWHAQCLSCARAAGRVMCRAAHYRQDAMAEEKLPYIAKGSPLTGSPLRHRQG